VVQKVKSKRKTSDLSDNRFLPIPKRHLLAVCYVHILQVAYQVLPCHANRMMN
jgi:hypothetical protein